MGSDLAAGKAGLLDHHGLGRVGEHFIDGLQEGGADGAGGATDGIGLVLGPLAVGLVRLLDPGVVVEHRAVYDVHDVLRALLNQQNVLDKVGTGPASRSP